MLASKNEILRDKSKNLCEKKYKVPKKDIKGKIKKHRDSPCPWIGKINIVEMSVLLQIQHSPIQNLSKLSHGC